MIRWRYNNGKLNHDSYNAGEIAYRHRIFSSNYYEKPQKKKKHNARVLQFSMGKAQKTLVLNGFVQIFLTYTINKKALIVFHTLHY